jgi:hypothetical protein
MNVLYKPLGGEYVFKTFPRISIPDRGKVVLDFRTSTRVRNPLPSSISSAILASDFWMGSKFVQPCICGSERSAVDEAC